MSKKYAGENTIQEVIAKTKQMVSAKQDAITSTNKLDYSLLSNTPTIPTVNNATLTDAITSTNKLDYSLLSNTPTIPTVNNATLTVQLNGSNVQTFTANQSTNATANIQALPNFSINISHQTAGNPRHVKFLSVNYTNYTSNAAAYFKLSATSCHSNGKDQFLEDIIIGVTSAGVVVCNVYKFCQASCGDVDGVAHYYGDVYYTIDTTNKVVDFYILCGQYAESQFTPFTKIGSTTTSGITQYSGTASYYSSGTKVWASGNAGTYIRTADVQSLQTQITNLQTQINNILNGTTTFTKVKTKVVDLVD